MGLIQDWLRGKSTTDIMNSQLEIPVELMDDIRESHLQTMALDSVINYICSRASLVRFQTDDPALFQLLNFKPNRNQNAIDFRTKLLRNLFLEGECLVLKTKADELVIADFWSVKPFAFMETEYTDILVRGYPLNKTYKASEVFHFEYFNPNLKHYINQLNKSYDKLFARLHQVQLTQNQIRFYANFNTSTSKNEDNQDKFKKFLENFKTAVSNNQVVVMPTQKDYEITEHSSNYLGRSAEELERVEKTYIKDVCQFFSFNPAVLDGSLADTSQHKDDFNKALKGIFKILTTELNAEYMTRKELAEGKEIKASIFDAVYTTELDAATPLEKLMGSGVYTIDDLLEISNRKRLNLPETTKRYITKNYGNLKGGEIVDDGKKSNGSNE